jgi:hypothetical protein
VDGDYEVAVPVVDAAVPVVGEVARAGWGDLDCEGYPVPDCLAD